MVSDQNLDRATYVVNVLNKCRFQRLTSDTCQVFDLSLDRATNSEQRCQMLKKSVLKHLFSTSDKCFNTLVYSFLRHGSRL